MVSQGDPALVKGHLDKKKSCSLLYLFESGASGDGTWD